MKAIMYHYVRGETARPPNYYHLDVEDFRRQLDYFKDNFGFVSKDEFISVVRGDGDRENLPSGVVLTFDDGLKDHYDVVFPELEKRGLWGIFYVPTGPYMTNQLLDVHRTHSLLGEVSGVELLEQVQGIVNEDMIPHKRRDDYRELTYKRQEDAKATKQVKRILNFYIADEFQSEVLNKLTDQVGYNHPDITEFYLTEDEIREMHKSGHVIGGHTVSHPVLSKLTKEDQREQIAGSLDYLDEVVSGLSERTFCYPYGDSYTFNEDTVGILQEENCEWCFKVEPSDIDKTDLAQRPQALPRYDCTEFPDGEASGSIGSSSAD
jgi:peptidoglycan/xylan/chitin deacetylase (PgdA/CDA1 family)